jgi:cytochrome P450
MSTLQQVTTQNARLRVIERNGYRLPSGLKHDLVWYALRGRFGPKDPIALFEFLGREFGEIAYYTAAGREIVFVNSPEYARELLVVQNDNFVKERTMQRSKLVLGEGMITAEGTAHKEQRRVAQPAFHRQRIGVYAEEIVRRAQWMRDTWRDGQTLDVSQQMMELTLATIARTLFSTELGERVHAINDAVNRIMGMYHYLVLLPAAERLAHWPIPPTPKLRKFKRSREALDGAVLAMIREHRQSGDTGDLLSMMLAERPGGAADDDRLRDEVITILLAGYETVANALTWTWYLLSQNPGVEARFHAEIDAVLGGRAATMEDLPRLRYTEMVLAESMRLYPPAWAQGRQALRDFELGPYRFRARTTVLLSQWMMHRNPMYFPDPERFDPERHTPEGKSQRPPFAYVPFGAGPRKCIGEAFAWMEATLVLATFAQQVRLRLSPGHRVEKQALITLRPRYGMKMVVQRRDLPASST